MTRAQSLTLRGRSSSAPVYTLKLDANGAGQLLDARGASLWTSDDEDDAAFKEQFGDFMEEDNADALVDWLFENVALPEGAEIEVDVEYDDGPGDEDDEDDEDDDTERYDEDEDEDEDDSEAYY